jgi:hypothetical protein
VKLENCTFRENSANIDAGTRLAKNQDGGGAIAVQNASLEMQGGSIFSNKVDGFAGGGIYFITAAYDDNAEKMAEITHGTTFEQILKQGYKCTSVDLKVSNVIFGSNAAGGETCCDDMCTLSPKAGFKACGAGGAIYALESLKDFGFPVTVLLDGIGVIENLSAHNEDKQKSDLVFRNITKLIVKSEKNFTFPRIAW